MRRLLTVIAVTGALVGSVAAPGYAATNTDPSLTPPPIPTTGTPEVQFVGAGASPSQPTDNESLVSVVVPRRTDDIYNVAVASNNPQGDTSTVGIGLRSVAAALQIDLVKGRPSSVTPVNGAYAYNYRCNGCFSYAFARQKLVYVPEDFRLTRSLRREISEISAAVAYEVRTDRTAAALDSDLAAQFARLDAAVAAAVRDSGDHQQQEG